jgi:hypothetical protein
MSAEADLNTVLLAYGPLTALVGTRIYRELMPADTSFPCCMFERVGTPEKLQVVTGAVVARSVRFQVTCYGEKAGGARAVSAVAAAVEAAMLSGIGTFIDVTLGDDAAYWNPQGELYEQRLECACLEAA